MRAKLLLNLLPALALCGCTHQIETKSDINLKPIEVKPVKITLDVNVNVKVDKALDSSFSDVDKAPGKPGDLAPINPTGPAQPGELAPINPNAPAAANAAPTTNPVKDAAITRIKARLAQINACKAAGTLGESNTGFLGLIKADPTAKTAAEAENGDRWTVYKEVAKMKGTTPEIVAKRRALRNIDRAPVGTWIQDPDNGQWKQKVVSPAAPKDQPANGDKK